MSHSPDLAALHDALGCAATAVVHAWRGERDSAWLSLIEAHAAAEEAFGCGSPEVEALNVVLAAITQAAAARAEVVAGCDVPAPRPASDLSRLGQERAMTTTIPQAPVAVIDLVRLASCGQCWQRPGKPCTVSGPPGDHLARYMRAERRGLISREDLAAVVAGLEVIAPHVIVPEVSR